MLYTVDSNAAQVLAMFFITKKCENSQGKKKSLYFKDVVEITRDMGEDH